MRDDLLAVPNGTLAPDMLLGMLTMFTVPDTPVPGGKLNKLWASEGLDPKLIPDVRKPVNVFQYACRNVETRRAALSNGHRSEVKVDEVLVNEQECVYQITRLVRDTTNQVIDHPKAMTLTLDRAAADAGDIDPIKVTPRDPTTFGALKGLADTVLDYYQKNLTTVPGQKVRNAVREYMRILGGENVRRKAGGVYFVPISGADTLDSLERVLTSLYGGDADLHTIPLANTKSAGQMIAKHHAINVIKECDEMIAQITQRLKTQKGKVRKDLMTNIVQRRRELGARRKQYIALLGQETQQVQGHLALLDEQIDRLMEASV